MPFSSSVHAASSSLLLAQKLLGDPTGNDCADG